MPRFVVAIILSYVVLLLSWPAVAQVPATLPDVATPEELLAQLEEAGVVEEDEFAFQGTFDPIEQDGPSVVELLDEPVRDVIVAATISVEALQRGELAICQFNVRDVGVNQFIGLGLTTLSLDPALFISNSPNQPLSFLPVAGEVGQAQRLVATVIRDEVNFWMGGELLLENEPVQLAPGTLNVQIAEDTACALEDIWLFVRAERAAETTPDPDAPADPTATLTPRAVGSAPTEAPADSPEVASATPIADASSDADDDDDAPQPSASATPQPTATSVPVVRSDTGDPAVREAIIGQLQATNIIGPVQLALEEERVALNSLDPVRYLARATSSSEFLFSANLLVNVADDSRQQCGLLARVGDDAEDFVLIGIDEAGAVFVLDRVDAEDQLERQPLNLDLSIPHNLLVVLRQDRALVYVNGRLSLSVDDLSLRDGLLGMGRFATSDVAACSLTDFWAYEITAPTVSRCELRALTNAPVRAEPDDSAVQRDTVVVGTRFDAVAQARDVSAGRWYQLPDDGGWVSEDNVIEGQGCGDLPEADE